MSDRDKEKGQCEPDTQIICFAPRFSGSLMAIVESEYLGGPVAPVGDLTKYL